MTTPVNFANTAISAVVTAVFHPPSYAKVLIQLGHEPLAAEPGKSFFFGLGKEVYFYPNIFRYTSYIWRRDGFLGMYKGLFPRVLGGQIGNLVQNAVLAKLREGEQEKKEGYEEEDPDWLKIFCVQTGQETVARCVAIIASQPFHVIMIRQMAQFVGGEQHYDSVFSSISEIYNTQGFSGFFSGIVPRLIGEIIQIWASNVIATLVNKYLIQSKEAKTYTVSVCGILIANFTYPFTLVSNMMAIAGSDLVAAQPPNMPPFTGWTDCWAYLRQQDGLKRGSSYFRRQVRGHLSSGHRRFQPALH